ncbi:MAG TPA: acetate--CoA ligase, partial [Candidatus Binatia bacterium]
MAFAAITKEPAGWKILPNLIDYEQTCSRFSWDETARELAGLPGGRGLNIAYESVERHALGPRRGHVALRWLGKQGETRDFTYNDLHFLSNRFANALHRLGVG